MSTDVQINGIDLWRAGCELKEVTSSDTNTEWQIKIPGYPYWREVSLIADGADDWVRVHFSVGGGFREYLYAWAKANQIYYQEF